MARQNSRYFTPVIKKLLDAKQKEAINVDEAFKTRLRAQLMTRALSNAKNDGESESWADGVAEFVRRWKYQLALVPTVLVLALVAVQAFKIPVKVPGSDTVVPVMEGGNTVTNISAEDIPSDEGIKTFAGRNVLPPDYYLKKNLQSRDLRFDLAPYAGTSYTAVSADEASSGNARTVGTGTVAVKEDAQPVAAGVTMQQLVYDSYAGGTGTQVTVAIRQPASTSVSSGVTEEDNVGTKTANIGESIESSRAQAETGLLYSVTTSADSTTDNLLIPQLVKEAPSTQLAPLQNVETAAAPTAVSKALLVKPQDSAPEKEIVAIPKSVTAAKENITEAPVIVNYNYSLTDSEKTDLEKKVIAALVNDKTVAYVNVDKADLGVVKITKTYENGKNEEFLYKKNASTGIWEQVKYAVRYYYDDSLEYVKMNLLFPAYSTYDSPLLYPYYDY
jgi:hypothetical protein